jgi:hypothetical protein
MPLAQGNLAELVTRTGPLQPPLIADIARQIATGLSYIHEQGVYHRDLKPANVLRLASTPGEAETWAISDFGLAVQAERDSAPLTSTNRHGLGSWVYTAPEQWQQARSANHLSDIYSFGKLLQELTYGETPFGETFPNSVFRPVIERATATSPTARYQSVQDLVNALDRALGGTRIHAEWETRDEQAERLRDQLLRNPTREELVIVAEWALELDEQQQEDVDALIRVLPWMTLSATKALMNWNSNAFSKIIERFCEAVGSGSFSFEYCDVLATYLRRITLATSDASITGQAIKTLARLGAHHNRWRVRDVLVQTIQEVRSKEASAEVVEALLSIPGDELHWSITDFTVRSLPAAIRAGLSQAIQA